MGRENEEKKEYLRGYQKAKKRERLILEQIQQLRMDKMFPCLQYDGMPHANNNSDLSEYIEKLDKLLEKLGKEKLESVRKYTEIQERIKASSEGDEKETLERRYLMGQTWDKIGEEMGYSRRTVLYIHGRALKKIKL